MRGGIEPPLIKNLCLRECISSHLETNFPYSITSILSKVVHSNTFFLTFSFEFPCRPLGALVRVPCGGGGHSKSESAKCSEKQQSPCEHVRGRGYKT